MCDQFTKTRFITVPIKETLNSGIPIGSGACEAVRLKLNSFQRNTIRLVVDDGDFQTPFLLYYGDSQRQDNELLAYITNRATGKIVQAFDWTPKIYCQNLEEIFIRYGGRTQGGNDWPVTANVQVMIYERQTK